jgi:hypothetical protein
LSSVISHFLYIFVLLIRLRKEVNESKALLESERKLRLKLEEQIHALEAQLQLQIDVPEVDNSEEITAHILGRKPNLPQKIFKVINYTLYFFCQVRN